MAVCRLCVVGSSSPPRWARGPRPQTTSASSVRVLRRKWYSGCCKIRAGDRASPPVHRRTPADIQRKLAGGEMRRHRGPSGARSSRRWRRRAHCVPASRVDLARVGVGVVVREGAPRPDISTVDAVRKMLVDARSIVYPDPAGGGQPGAALARMTATLGVADAVKPKLTLMQAIAGGVALVANGDAEVGMFNISEVAAGQRRHAGRPAAFGAAELYRLRRRHPCGQYLARTRASLHQASVRSGRQ